MDFYGYVLSEIRMSWYQLNNVQLHAQFRYPKMLSTAINFNTLKSQQKKQIEFQT